MSEDVADYGAEIAMRPRQRARRLSMVENIENLGDKFGDKIVGVLDRMVHIDPLEAAADSSMLTTGHFGLRDDRDVVMNAVMHCPQALRWADAGYKKDPAIVATAVATDGSALKHAHHSMKSNKVIVHAAVRSFGQALQHVSSELRDDRETVLHAVANDGLAMAFASDELRNDRLVVLQAVPPSPWLAQVLSLSLRLTTRVEPYRRCGTSRWPWGTRQQTCGQIGRSCWRR